MYPNGQDNIDIENLYILSNWNRYRFRNVCVLWYRNKYRCGVMCIEKSNATSAMINPVHYESIVLHFLLKPIFPTFIPMKKCTLLSNSHKSDVYLFHM